MSTYEPVTPHAWLVTVRGYAARQDVQRRSARTRRSRRSSRQNGEGQAKNQFPACQSLTGMPLDNNQTDPPCQSGFTGVARVTAATRKKGCLSLSGVVPSVPSSAIQCSVAVHSAGARLGRTAAIIATPPLPSRFHAADRPGGAHPALPPRRVLRSPNGLGVQIQRESVRKNPATPSRERRVRPMRRVGP